MSTLNTFILLTITSTPTTVKCKVLLRFLGNNIYANDPQCNVLTLSILLWFNRNTEKEKEREKEESNAQRSSESHIYMGTGKEKGYSFVSIFPRYARSSYW